MDELTIRTKYTRGLIRKIVQKLVKKKLGVDIGLDILRLNMTVPSDVDGSNVQLRIEADIDISKKDLHDLIMKNI